MIVTLCSGGLDSVTLVYWLLHQDYEPHLLFVDYGQRHLTERVLARRTALRLNLPFTEVQIVGDIYDSALTGQGDIPTGTYAEDNLARTVVPNRNATFACLAASLAIKEGTNLIAMGMHAGDHALYRDCTPEFVVAMEHALQVATGKKFEIVTPFIYETKTNIVEQGAKLGVPFVMTWSCYKGGTVHCGKCSTCLERKSAFQLAGITDPTYYAGDGWS